MEAMLAKLDAEDKEKADYESKDFFKMHSMADTSEHLLNGAFDDTEAQEFSQMKSGLKAAILGGDD